MGLLFILLIIALYCGWQNESKKIAARRAAEKEKTIQKNVDIFNDQMDQEMEEDRWKHPYL